MASDRPYMPERGPAPRIRFAAGRGLPATLLGVYLVLAGGCGYHLRESAGLPPGFEIVYVDSPTLALDRAISEHLLGAGVARAQDPKSAQAVIHVDTEGLSEQLLSVDPDTGKASEYQVELVTGFSVRGPTGRTLIPHQPIRIVRDYIFDRDAVIGKSRERVVLQKEMRRDAVAQIFNRIRAYFRKR